MAVGSGNFGTVHGGAGEILEVLSWKLTKKAAVHQYCTNTCNGYKKTVAGTKSGSGTITGLLDGALGLTEGVDVTLQLYYSASGYYTVPATTESVEIDVDIDEGKPVSWSASFVTDGEWS
jgi:hypothetical protein